jgi:hypothetical protein
MQAFDQGTIAKNILLFFVCSSQSVKRSSIWNDDHTPAFRVNLEDKLSPARIAAK